ncbi:MAG TPA: DUF1836 domain-containing protein [Candidatus Fusicatenibacter intestinigallinarum]|uniref:DUF1836 domain-containing protein n=1 Tax=Candidatus Fusicatenibacter intestinigallinarum TaxID=2838598 RepID=A0A9D2NAU3_9FIRM|nr:DUF1836 domain-containing protein [Candidatus Fusicatenibacter intestinigallinarum]
MNIDTETLLQDLLDSLSKVDGVHPEDVPNIDLYMDQVTTFMDARLASSKRYEEDKILTKTMINNYAKNHLLPPPEKKKYSKEHMLVLIFIYYFKNILSINDIQTLLEPITKKYFHSEDGFSISDLYQEIFELERSEIGTVREDVVKTFEAARASFADAPEEDREFLQIFSFICMLSFDVYLKKQLIEELIDKMAPEKNRQK